MPLAAAYAEILVCPQCHGAFEERTDGLFCAKCALLFPIRDGLPVLLREEATDLNASANEDAA